MKAAVLNSVPGELEIEEIEIGAPGPREVLVRTAAAGVCHSDLHFMEGKYPYPCPAVLGHESAGVVEAVGSMVHYVQPGDCENKHTELVRQPGEAPRLSRDGEPVNQFLHLSSFAEQMLIHEQALVKIDKDMPFDKAALIGCGVTTGLGAVFRTAKVAAGESVAVIGAGGIGLAAIQGARISGANKIIAVDMVESKLELAQAMGATHVVNASETDPVEAVRELTGGVHHSFEAVGLKATAEQSFQMVRNGGQATVIGMIPVGTKVEVNGTDLLYEKKLTGSNMGSNQFRTDMPRFVDMYIDGRLKLDEMISNRISLEQINDGFTAMKSGSVAPENFDTPTRSALSGRHFCVTVPWMKKLVLALAALAMVAVSCSGEATIDGDGDGTVAIGGAVESDDGVAAATADSSGDGQEDGDTNAPAATEPPTPAEPEPQTDADADADADTEAEPAEEPTAAPTAEPIPEPTRAPAEPLASQAEAVAAVTSAGDWCAAAEAIEAGTSVIDSPNLSDPVELEQSYMQANAVVNAASPLAPAEIAQDWNFTVDMFGQLSAAFEDADWDVRRVDASALQGFDFQMQEATYRIEKYNFDTCAIGTDPGEAPTPDDTQPVEVPPGSVRDQTIQGLIGAGFTEEEAACVFDNLDLTDLQSLNDPAAMGALLQTCGIPIERLLELGG